MNAVKLNRTQHAYLLTGSRGIGKTSIARIFAKTLRCESTSWTSDGFLKSCDECSNCKEISSGNAVNVIEIDGASNNGVDAVREIRENAKYLPASGSRKIYIIDEVHMLTTAAFNALLKTLEEPPPHVVFIFATTEAHKIPSTILSRCQRFDLKRITSAQIQARMSHVLAAENIKAEPGALALIARASEGSMRDGLSLLDQVIAFSDHQITVQATRESIGLIEGEALLKVAKAIFAREPKDALAVVDQAFQQGFDLRVLTRSLIELIYGAILIHIDASQTSHLELSSSEWEDLKSISKLRTLEEIELIFQVLHRGLDWIARSPQPKMVLDVLLIKCTTAEALVTIGNSSGPTAPIPSQSNRSGNVASSSSNQMKSAPSAPISTPQEVVTPPATLHSDIKSNGPKSWTGLIEHVRTTRPLLASILEHGSAEYLEADGLLQIHFDPKDAYFKDQLQSKVYTEQLSTLSKEYYSPQVRVRIDLKEGGESLAAKREREIQERNQAAKDRAKNHPIIAEARALFGGDLGPIEVLDGQSPEDNS